MCLLVWSWNLFRETGFQPFQNLFCTSAHVLEGSLFEFKNSYLVVPAVVERRNEMNLASCSCLKQDGGQLQRASPPSGLIIKEELSDCTLLLNVCYHRKCTRSLREKGSVVLPKTGALACGTSMISSHCGLP